MWIEGISESHLYVNASQCRPVISVVWADWKTPSLPPEGNMPSVGFVRSLSRLTAKACDHCFSIHSKPNLGLCTIPLGCARSCVLLWPWFSYPREQLASSLPSSCKAPCSRVARDSALMTHRGSCSNVDSDSVALGGAWAPAYLTSSQLKPGAPGLQPHILARM